MVSPIDYLAAAVAEEIRRPSGIEVTDLAAIKTIFAKRGVELVDNDAQRVALRLQSLGFLRVVKDEYAGQYYEPASAGVMPFRIDRLKKNESAPGFIYALSGGPTLLSRAFANQKFWSDFEAGLDEEPEQGLQGTFDVDQVPASDRIVTLSHNSPEGQALAQAVQAVVDDLNVNNAVADEAGPERERLIAEGKASIELLRGERLRKSALIELIWKFLKEVAAKFKEKAVDWGVDHALEVMAKMMDLLN